MMADSNLVDNIVRTGTARVVPFDDLMKKMPTVKGEFRDTSPEYIFSTLQLRLKGLRGKLGSVAIVSRDNPSADETPNYYYRKGAKIIIRDFKTRQHHDKYSFTIRGELKNVVEKSLRKRPRSFLIGDNGMDSAAVGNMLKKTLGVKVDHIRHSMISMLLDQYHTEAHAREIAKLFKHEWTMTLRYYDNDVEESPGPDPDIVSDNEN